jgi:hypothetical protein
MIVVEVSELVVRLVCEYFKLTQMSAVLLRSMLQYMRGIMHTATTDSNNHKAFVHHDVAATAQY